jgi:hypothetical protein
MNPPDILCGLDAREPCPLTLLAGVETGDSVGSDTPDLWDL